MQQRAATRSPDRRTGMPSIDQRGAFSDFPRRPQSKLPLACRHCPTVAINFRFLTRDRIPMASGTVLMFCQLLQTPISTLVRMLHPIRGLDTATV